LANKKMSGDVFDFSTDFWKEIPGLV
jgi:hypothetical protein